MLQVVIGIIFVLLLLSLLATTVMELIAATFSLRGKNLEKALKNMLASTDLDEKLLGEFKENALYQHLSSKFGKKRRSPSYISAPSFRVILMDIIMKGEGWDKLEEKIEEIPDENLRKVLYQLLRESDYRLDVFKLKLENWYDDVMDRASGWYKRNAQKILIFIGLFIAVAFNADTLAIYERLETNPEARMEILQMAEEYANSSENSADLAEDPAFEQSLTDLKSMIRNDINHVKSPLGLGWKNVSIKGVSFYVALTKLLGWLVTALSISLGAPFWFDLLRKLVNIRNTGRVPAESTKA
ncbi:MAG: hypothetical protein GY705_27340 [Bacteroidetes bacterium]|nr:hypothetical protein [Bacteroidota bacterium]